MKKIDLRSDTVTKPNQEMLKAMMSADVGDDVFGEDPTILKLQEFASDLMGYEAALFCPSGTMTNQIALFLHSAPMTEILLHPDSHVYQYEGGGISMHARASVKFLQGERGKIKAEDIQNAINPNDVHRPKSALVSLENTTNRGGGATYSLAELKNIKKNCEESNLKLHLDGARAMNALVAQNEKMNAYQGIFDSFSLCLSKGLGAPVGSLLLGKKEFIAEARRVRKVFGGGMRQAGYLAAAGLYALQHNIEKLYIDHEHAKLIEEKLNSLSWVHSVLKVETNIVIFNVIDSLRPEQVVKALEQKGIHCLKFGPQSIRMVTHLDIAREDIEFLLKELSSLRL